MWKNISPSRLADIIIYTLLVILITLILYNIFLLVHIPYSAKTPPRNSIQVFPS